MSYNLTTEQYLKYTGYICPYCDNQSVLTDSEEVYGRSYGPIWVCRECKAWVGCHPGTTKPLGRLANAELRRLKKKAHEAFDKTWKSGKMRRSKAYKWLSEELGTPKEYTHIGMFNETTCRRVIELCTKK